MTPKFNVSRFPGNLLQCQPECQRLLPQSQLDCQLAGTTALAARLPIRYSCSLQVNLCQLVYAVRLSSGLSSCVGRCNWLSDQICSMLAGLCWRVVQLAGWRLRRRGAQALGRHSFISTVTTLPINVYVQVKYHNLQPQSLSTQAGIRPVRLNK